MLTRFNLKGVSAHSNLNCTWLMQTTGGVRGGCRSSKSKETLSKHSSANVRTCDKKPNIKFLRYWELAFLDLDLDYTNKTGQFGAEVLEGKAPDGWVDRWMDGWMDG